MGMVPVGVGLVGWLVGVGQWGGVVWGGAWGGEGFLGGRMEGGWRRRGGGVKEGDCEFVGVGR